MNKDDIVLFICLYLIGCIIIFIWQHRDSIFNKSKKSSNINSKKVSTSLDEDVIESSKNFLLVNSLFFTNNYFDFDKFLDFVSNVEEENISFSEAFQALSLLNLLVRVSSSLSNDFEHQLFFSNRDVLSIKEVKDKILNDVYTGTVADFYEIIISVIFHYKKFLIYK